MRLMPVCRRRDGQAEDPLYRIVREKYHVQPVAMPRGAIDLLGVLVQRDDGSFKPYGPIGALVTGKPLVEEAVGPRPREPEREVSGVQSSAFDAGVGIEVLAALLRVFGVPVPGAKAAFAHSRSVSFKFSGVTQRVCPMAVLGAVLVGRALRKRNTATREIQQNGGALVIDSVLESPDFQVSVKRRSKWHAGIDWGLLGETVTPELGLSMQQLDDQSVSFRADQPAVFGFTAQRFEVADLGKITTLTFGPSTVVVRGIKGGRDVLYSSDRRGLDLAGITSREAEAIYGDSGLVEAVDIPDGPLVVNVVPVELSDEPGLLVPDDEDLS